MTATPNDVWLRHIWGKHCIIATEGSNIIFVKQMHHIAARRYIINDGNAVVVSHHAFACMP